MKSRLILMLAGALVMGSFAYGDIQAPPGSRWTWSRKLARAVANIAYGTTEYPTAWSRSLRQDGSSAAISTMVVEGSVRSVTRLGYGIFELVTFPVPAYKDSYRPPYYLKDHMDLEKGYSEFPPQIGFSAESNYCREQPY